MDKNEKVMEEFRYYLSEEFDINDSEIADKIIELLMKNDRIVTLAWIMLNADRKNLQVTCDEFELEAFPFIQSIIKKVA